MLPNSEMSAARHQNDILQMFYGEIPAQVNRRLPRPLNPRVVEIEDVFFTSQNNYNEWLRVWKMIVSERNPHNKDLFEFARATKESFTQLIKRELKELKNIKVSLEMKVKFKKEEEEQTQYIEHYFRENEPQVFNANDDENQIEEYFDNIFERINGKIEAWVAEGSGWEVEKIELMYVNVARFQPRDAACVEFVNYRIDDMTQKKFLKFDGTNSMTAVNVDFMQSEITSLSDLVSQTIHESHITSSTNKKDAFRYLMEDADESSSENNIDVLGINDFPESPHQINKKAYFLKLLFEKDSHQYRSRLGFNLHPLPVGYYTMVVE